MQPPPNQWPSTEYAKHAQFIAQTILESLSERNFESFRAPSLDDVERLREISRSAQSNFRATKPLTDFRPMIAELQETLAKSLAAKISPEEVSVYLRDLDGLEAGNKSFLKRLRLGSHITLRSFEDVYLTRLKNTIKELFSSPNEKIKSYNSIKELISFLLNSGYSKDFINLHCKECFFEKDIKKYNSHITDRFLERFDGSDRLYEVYIPIQKQNFPFFRELLIGDFLRHSELPLRLRRKISSEPAYSTLDRFYRTSIYTKDGNAAVRRAMSSITRRAATSVIYDKGFIPKPRNYAFVKRSGTETFRATINPDRHIQEASTSITNSQAARLVQGSNELTKSFNIVSVRRIISANETVALVRSSENSETQLSLIWSAFEALIGDPLDSSSRIQHFIEMISPCVCLNYPWRYSEAIFHQLQIHHRKTLDSSLNSAGVELSLAQLKRFQYFIFEPTFSPHHREFLAKLERNPALQFQIFLLYRDFSDPKAAKKRWETHEKKVRWQLHRIYRIRNDFIHAGKRHKSTRAVALNSYEYYRTLVAAITHYGFKLVQGKSMPKDEITIDYVISALRLEYHIRKNKLNAAISEGTKDFSQYMDFFSRV